MPEDLQVLLPLSTRAFYILLALAEEERHGYALLKAIETMTDGTVRLTAGTLYPLIHQMSIDGWILELAGDGIDSRRRRYKLSALGKRVAQAEALRLADLVRRARLCKLLPVTVQR